MQTRELSEPLVELLELPPMILLEDPGKEELLLEGPVELLELEPIVEDELLPVPPGQGTSVNHHVCDTCVPSQSQNWLHSLPRSGLQM